MAETMPYRPGIWRMYSSLTGSVSPYQRKVIFKALLQGGVISMSGGELPFDSAHRQTLNHVFLENHRQNDRWRHDSHGGSHHATPVDFGIGQEVVDGDRQGFGPLHTEHLREHEVVPG